MKTVIVTGASQGIGKATSEYFAQKGWRLILVSRDEKKLQEVAKKLPGSHFVVTCDFAQPLQVELAAQKCLDFIKTTNEGTIDCIVNNVGIYQQVKFEDTTAKDWLTFFSVNLISSALFTKVIWQQFQKQKSGSVVNISSNLGQRPVAMTSIYSATKAAMINWTECLALEGAPDQIRANCICPGVIETPIRFADDNQKTRDLKNQLAALHPLKRLGSPQEVAAAIYFLASEESAFTTGSILNVSGGIHLV